MYLKFVELRLIKNYNFLHGENNNRNKNRMSKNIEKFDIN